MKTGKLLVLLAFFVVTVLYHSYVVECRGGVKGGSHKQRASRARKSSSFRSTPDDGNGKLIGIIVGSVIGGSIMITLVVFLTYYFCSSKRKTLQVSATSNDVPVGEL